MTTRHYEITVGATLARSNASVIGAWVNDWARAKAQVDAIMSAPMKAPKAAGKDPRVASAEAAAKELDRIRERENNAILRDVEKTAKAEERAHEKAARNVAAIKERYFREEQARGEKADAERDNRNKRIISGSFDNMRKVAAVATRIAGEVVGGMGVDTSLSSLIGKGVRSESIAGTIVNAGYIEGAKGSAGVRQNPADVIREMKEAADVGAVSIEKAGDALYMLTKKSSDLKLSRDLLKDVAQYALATGTDLEAAAENAGNIARKIGDVPNAKELVMGALRVQGRAGKVGAIDASEFAAVVGATVGPSNKFAGGNTAAMAQLMVLAQMTKGSGETVAGAGTAVRAFVGDLTSVSGQKHLKTGGFSEQDIFANKGQLKSVESIISKAFELTGGDLSKMSAMFRNKRTLAAAMSFEQTYMEAEGKKKGSGIEAIHEVFKSYGGAMSDKDIKDSAALKQGETAAQVQLFNNTMEEVANDIRASLLPALKEAAPIAKDLAKAFAWVVKEAVQNPGGAILAAIIGSIGKAVIGETIGKAIASNIGSAGLTVGAVTATVAMAYLAIKEYNEEKQKAGEEERAKTEATEDLVKRAQTQLKSGGKVDADTMNEIIRRRAELEGARGRAGRYDENQDVNFFQKFGAKVYEKTFGEGNEGKTLAQYEGGGAENAKSKETLDKQATVLDGLLKAATDARRNPSADEIGSAVAKAVAPLVQPTIAAPTTGTVPQ